MQNANGSFTRKGEYFIHQSIGVLRINTTILLIKKQTKKRQAQGQSQNLIYGKSKGKIGLLTSGIWGNSIFND